MKLKILKEEGTTDAAVGGVADTGGAVSSMSISVPDNISVGSNVVNYGPNNPYFSNLREQKAKKKRAEKKRYGSKNAGHRGSKRRKPSYDEY